jgi:hypothetical protein
LTQYVQQSANPFSLSQISLRIWKQSISSQEYNPSSNKLSLPYSNRPSLCHKSPPCCSMMSTKSATISPQENSASAMEKSTQCGNTEPSAQEWPPQPRMKVFSSKSSRNHKPIPANEKPEWLLQFSRLGQIVSLPNPSTKMGFQLKPSFAHRALLPKLNFQNE